VKVIEDGRVVECLAVPGDDLGVLTNCCFGGPDGRTLFVNYALHGRVLAWESMPSPGLPLHPWPVPSA
jgi:sugar lactone lactonase YvrE